MLQIRRTAAAVLLTAGLVGAGPSAASAASTVPAFAHVVVVIMENHSRADVIGDPAAPYITSLARSGADFTQSYGVTHPSQPNYLALFSGSTQGVTSDTCPVTLRTSNLGAELRARSLWFDGYAESMPAKGYTGCASGSYVRKHNPWVDFTDLPAGVDHTMSGFPTTFTALPTVALVVPDLQHDMHDGTIAQADSWLKATMSAYVTWARTHDSILLLTWDEDDYSASNNIPTVVVGAHVRTGTYAERIDHYRVLRTLEAAYALPLLGATTRYQPITDSWS